MTWDTIRSGHLVYVCIFIVMQITKRDKKKIILTDFGLYDSHSHDERGIVSKKNHL